MKKMLILVVLLFSCCGLKKHQERTERDSLLSSSLQQELLLKEERAGKTEWILDKVDKQAVVIIADAPFRWQVDSGLTASAGRFEVYNQQEVKGTSVKKELEKWQVNSKNKNEAQKEVKVNEKTMSKILETPNLRFYSGMVLLICCLIYWLGYKFRTMKNKGN